MCSIVFITLFFGIFRGEYVLLRGAYEYNYIERGDNFFFHIYMTRKFRMMELFDQEITSRDIFSIL